MAEIKLFIASTLDGYIARENHSLDWLTEFDNPDNTDYGYAQFLSQIDTVLIGRKTYEEVLRFDVGWPYSEMKTYVATTDQSYIAQTENTEIVNEISISDIENWKSESIKNIWLIGGGKLITHFLNLQAIDEILISVIPVILGNGIRMFPNNTVQTDLRLMHSEAFSNGVINLSYRKRN